MGSHIETNVGISETEIPTFQLQLLAGTNLSHVLMAMCASDVHTNEVESRSFNVLFRSMTFEILSLFLKVLAQTFVLWRRICDVPGCRLANFTQGFRRVIDSIKVIKS